MRSGRYIPDKGDIVWLDFNPQTGREQRGKRPAIVISPKLYNEKTSLCICFPITSKIKNYPFEVKLDKKLPIKGVILSDQIKSLDFAKREISFMCKATDNMIKEIQEKIFLLLS